MAAYFGGTIPWAVIGDLSDGVVTETESTITEEGFNNSTARWVEPGSVLIAMYGSIGKLGIAGRRMTTNQAIAFTNPTPIDSKYLYYFLLSQRSSLARLSKGATQLNISQTVLKDFPFLLAPSAEQSRIVAKIEVLFSELDKGVEALTTARQQLAAYRHAILKHAFEGKLTEDWRSRNPDKVRLPTERLANIPADLADYCTERWTWRRLGDVSKVTGGLTKNPKRSALPITMRYLRVANVYADRLELDEVTEIGVTEDEFQNVRLQPGDMLVVEGNGSVEQIGRVAVWNGELEDVGHQNHLIRVRFIPGILPRFFLSFLMSPLGRDLIVRQASSTSGLHTLSISKVSGLPVPVPGTEEQEALLEALGAPMSEIENLAAEIESGLARCEALRQSIFKQAFSGQLVAQDPKDEPASMLLDRIRAERKEEAPRKRRDGRNGKKVAA